MVAPDAQASLIAALAETVVVPLRDEEHAPVATLATTRTTLRARDPDFMRDAFCNAYSAPALK